MNKTAIWQKKSRNRVIRNRNRTAGEERQQKAAAKERF
jgi:hypothetical protein